jgi:hypothetical protein
MKKYELEEALRLINKVSVDPRVGPDLGDRLKKVKQRLKKFAKAGRPNKRQAYLVAKCLAEILLEVVQLEVTPR